MAYKRPATQLLCRMFPASRAFEGAQQTDSITLCWNRLLTFQVRKDNVHLEHARYVLLCNPIRSGSFLSRAPSCFYPFPIYRCASAPRFWRRFCLRCRNAIAFIPAELS
jgi:hypothetical protein